MRRKIITIDEEKCTGCGQCIPDCPEGALQILDGKARLISDLFCDGLGACIGTCPEGAISVIEREAEPYDEKVVMAGIAPQGQAVIRAHLEHLISHGETGLYNQAVEYMNDHHVPFPISPPPLPHDPHTVHPFAGCLGSVTRTIPRRHRKSSQLSPCPAESELRQWPVQLSLLDPSNPYFDDADLLLAADCVPFAYADFHREFLKGKILIIFCPKLDTTIDEYITKLSTIISGHTIHSITIAHMEVPCCSGVSYVLDKAMQQSGKKIPVKEYTISLQGEIIDQKE